MSSVKIRIKYYSKKRWRLDAPCRLNRSVKSGYHLAHVSAPKTSKQATRAVETACCKKKLERLLANTPLYRRQAARPSRATRLTLEAAILLAEPLKVVLTAGVVAGVRPSDADGADGADGAEGADGADEEMVPAEAEPTGTRVVLLNTGYGATGTVALLSMTMGAAGPVLRMTDGAVLRMTDGAVLRMTAGVEEIAATTGAEGTIGVTVGATGDEETATGVAVVATTGYVVVQGQSLIVNVVACGKICQPTPVRWIRLQSSEVRLPQLQCEPCR